MLSQQQISAIPLFAYLEKKKKKIAYARDTIISRILMPLVTIIDIFFILRDVKRTIRTKKFVQALDQIKNNTKNNIINQFDF